MSLKNITQPQQSQSLSQSTRQISQRKCACGKPITSSGECAECRKKRLGLQRKAVTSSSTPEYAPPIVHEVLRQPGRPLPPTTRTFMEPRFGHAMQNRSLSNVRPAVAKSGLQIGAANDPLEREAEKTANAITHAATPQPNHHDLSHVRIHTGNKAAQSAKSVNARAYTLGQNIVFGAGQYQPATLSGQRLLAHELTHVRQQRREQSARLQRQTLENDPATAPPMSCEVASSSPIGVSLDIMFDINSPELSPLSKAAVSNFVRNWHQSPVEEEVEVHGFASIDGSPTTNWPLSCDRAEFLANELMTPSDGSQGIPATYIRVIAHGETNQFSSSLAPNRRAQAFIPAPVNPNPPPTPKQPTQNRCQNTKRVTIDLVKLAGSNRDPASDLAFANTVFRQCCVQFVKKSEHTATLAETTRWLGGDRDLQRIHSCSSVHQEEKDLREKATSRFGLSGRYKVFYVRSMHPRLRGVNFSPDCGSGDRSPFNRHLYVANSAGRRTLAHELGHIPIRGLRDHSTHNDGTRNLMEPTNTATGEHLTSAQCVEVRNNI